MNRSNQKIKNKYPAMPLCACFLALAAISGCALRPQYNDYIFDYSQSLNISQEAAELSIMQILTPIADERKMTVRWSKDDKIVFMTPAREETIYFEPKIMRITLAFVDRKDSIKDNLVNRISNGLQDKDFGYTLTHERSQGSFLLP